MDLNTFLTWFGIDLARKETLWQVYATLAIVLIVGIANHFFYRRLESHITETGKKLTHLSLRASQRVFAPVFALALFYVARTILSANQFPYDILDVAIPLALAFAAIRITIYLLRKAFTVTPLLKAWENLLALAIWTIFALHILGLLDSFIEFLDSIALYFGGNKISLLGAIKTIISLTFFVLLALWISRLIERKLAASNLLSGYLKIGITKTVRVVAILIASLIALDVIGFDLTTLTVLGGALGIGIGFGLQRIASNFISGFILLFDRSIRPNDVISIGEKFGWIKELRSRYVVIQDRDGVETLIPNENLVTSEVVNWSFSNRNFRVKVPVQISYNDDPELAMELMIEAANESDRILTDPPAVARLMAFADHGIQLELRFWIDDPENGLNNVRSEVNLRIWKKFKSSHITIPYPQRDVHLDMAPNDRSGS